MQKTIYTLEQLTDHIEADWIDEIKNAAMFLSVYYIKAWYSAPNAFDAPVNDLDLFKYF